MRKYIQKSIGQSLVQINCHRTPFSLLLLTQYNSELLNNNRGLQKELWNKVKWQICLGQKDRGNSITRRNVVAIVINRRLQNVVLRCNLKNDRMISVHFQGKPFNIMVTQVYALKSNTEEAKVEWFCEDLQDLLELTPKKRCPFHYREQNAKVESQETPGVTGKFGLGVKNEAGQRLIEFCQENSKHPLPTTQEKTLYMGITRWSTPKSDWLYSLHPKMEKLYTVSKNKTGSWLWLRSWTAYCQFQT